MKDIMNFLQELSKNTGISFSISTEDGSNIFSSDSFEENRNMIYVSIVLGREKARIHLDNKFKECASLLKYAIEDKYKDIYSETELIISDILAGKDVSDEKVNKSIPFLELGCNLLLVKTTGSIYEAIDIIKEIYKKFHIITMIYDYDIIILGKFDEVEDHAKAIKEAINSNLFCKCSVSYGNNFHNKYEIKRAFHESEQSMMLSKKFSVRKEVLDYNKLLFEKIVYSLDPKLKQEFLDKFEAGFDAFDSEMLLTIDEFVNCGLNTSDAARKLYVHRNTLIYRLDKIKKETGFDIRNFREATVFTISFLIWREKKQNKQTN